MLDHELLSHNAPCATLHIRYQVARAAGFDKAQTKKRLQDARVRRAAAVLQAQKVEKNEEEKNKTKTKTKAKTKTKTKAKTKGKATAKVAAKAR